MAAEHHLPPPSCMIVKTTQNSDWVTTLNTSLSVNGSISTPVHEQLTALTALQDQVKRINDHLAILTPKPELLEKHEALRTAYNEYKILEALLLEENS